MTCSRYPRSLFQWCRHLASGRHAWSCALPLALALLLPAASRGADPPSCAGITEPFFDVTLSFPVPGILSRQGVEEGDAVNTNKVMLELDSWLEELEVERRKLVLLNRQEDFESTRVVFEKSSSVSRDELLKKEADFKIAAAEYETAVEQLKRRRLLSPGAGVVAELRLRLGEACSAYEPVVRVVDTRRCYFISNVDPRISKEFKVGDLVKLEIEDGAGAFKVSGTVVFVSPVVDSASGLQKVKVLFENLEGKVRPGVAGRIVRE